MIGRGATAVVLAVFLTSSFATPARAAVALTFTVNATDNTDDGSCDLAHCSLREAINAANANPSPAPDQDRIGFDLPGAAPHTIAVAQSIGELLPVITDPVIIDGTTQPDYAGSPTVEISGSDTPFQILWISGGHSTVRGLVLNHAAWAVYLIGAEDNLIERNYIGTDMAGEHGLRGGIYGSESPNTRILHNLISGGPSSDTVVMVSPGTTLEGNRIGTTRDGMDTIGGRGVSVCCDDNLIGGTAPGAGNLISGLTGPALAITGSSLDPSPSGSRIQGNLIGTNATGTGAASGDDLGNGGEGILLFGDDALVGGSTPDARNVVAGSLGYAIFVVGSRNRIEGNFIGTDATGMLDFGNNGGVLIEGGPSNDNTVGGTDGATPGACTGACNLISGNDVGVSTGGSSTLVEGNFIGTDITGTRAIPNRQFGVGTGGPTSFGDHLIVGNLISGNVAYGVYVSDPGTTVKGNLVGTDVTGTQPLGNGGIGVSAIGTGDVVGGLNAADRNLISGNASYGVEVDGGANSLVAGNYIGTDVTGQAAIANGAGGVLAGDVNFVGAPNAGNVISGNGGPGISNLCCSNGLRIRGNLIGTDATGTKALGNHGDGIVVGFNDDIVVGGTSAGESNVISANAGDGASFCCGGNRRLVLGNLIGTDVTGTVDLGNTGAGVRGNSVTVGGVAAAAHNTIKFNGGGGVAVPAGVGTSILGNSIEANVGLGIDLEVDGVTPNDLADADSGANDRQNFPIVTTIGPGGTTVEGSFDSRPSETFRIELYSNSTCDDSGYGEGGSYVGSTSVLTDTTGHATFGPVGVAAIPVGNVVTATATDSQGSTSEFSPCATRNPDLPGTIVIRKVTEGGNGTFAFTSEELGGFSLTTSGGSTSRTFTDLDPGAYSVVEGQTTGWDLAAASCDEGSTPDGIELAAGEIVTCTFTNRAEGTISVRKTVAGAAPSGAQSFMFEVRQNASTTAAGTTLESQTATTANGGVVSFSTLLVAGSTYQLCEIVMPGWKTSLSPTFVVFNASGDNSTLCTDFSVQPGQARTVAVDNTPPPGGLARTIGFWKNWASCANSNGGRKPVLDQTLASAEPSGVTIGTFTLHGSAKKPNVAPDCQKAVNLLNKTTIDGKTKKASDPAFGLASQLLAARLDLLAGAAACPAAVADVGDAQSLLLAIHFDGLKHDVMSVTQVSQATNLATFIDRYNNDQLC